MSLLLACRRPTDDAPQPGPASTSATPPASVATRAPAPESLRGPRQGSAIALTQDDKRLYVADEDRAAVWRVALPLDPAGRAERIPMPGPPAQLLVVRDKLLVTVRDPGLLLVLGDGPEGAPEEARVPLAPDAWGLGVSADLTTALVTSAWSHTVTGVDLAAAKIRWSLEVAREPRAVVVPTTGDHAYVSHLVGAALTRIDGIGGSSPTAKPVPLPPAPSRAPHGETLPASLGYAAVLSPDERLLFVARHALGALGLDHEAPTWFGAATVDALRTDGDEPLAPPRVGRQGVARLADYVKDPESWQTYQPVRLVDGPEGPLSFRSVAPFVQPRALVYRASTRTLLVASEGRDELIELDALALEPAQHRVQRYRLGAGYHADYFVAKSGAAPTGIALSADESTAYVFCRASFEVLAVRLAHPESSAGEEPTVALRLADDPLLEGIAPTDARRKFREAAALGRRLFYNALDVPLSGGMGCAGCHPEGRDDGHVWHEIEIQRFGDRRDPIFVGGAGIVRQHQESGMFGDQGSLHGPPRARQTPMLAGRVRAEGPYGWLAESKTLSERLKSGFGLHRWSEAEPVGAEGRAMVLVAFLRAGLAPPPRAARELDETERRGRALFTSPATGCTACHIAEDEYTNRAATAVPLPPRRGFADESSAKFKTPSLLYVGGTPPYFHDGSAASLEELVRDNRDRMGKTSHLSAADQQALVAFLRTL
jgi:DNA-binding beta-propeller fold protein YncE